jgi:hypothetical protein
MRYIIFAGYAYYPDGGGYDFVTMQAQFEDATRAADAVLMNSKKDWSHVFDTNEKKIVYHGKRS